ncbi:MAG: hypothetical protein SF187_12050 [Deltaproteobacteria bacterium]|nr:hypothetical protein [Deltaproteobacteria bacterium]
MKSSRFGLFTLLFSSAIINFACEDEEASPTPTADGAVINSGSDDGGMGDGNAQISDAASADVSAEAGVDSGANDAAPPTASCTPLISDFTSNTDGFTQTGITTFEQRSSGGNPGGLLYADTSDLDLSYVFAGAKFVGDQTSHIGGTLRFDGTALAVGGTAWTKASEDYGWVRITSPFGVLERDLVPGDMGPPLMTWTTYSVPLTPDAWGVSASQLRDILSNVTELRICVEALFGAEIQALDNVQLTCPGAVEDR